MAFTKRSPGMVILLSIITCGIYGAYWYYKIGVEINTALGRQAIAPVLAIIALFTGNILLIYYMYTLDKALVELAARAGAPYSEKFILWLILTLLCGVGVFVCEYQVQNFGNDYIYTDVMGGGQGQQ